MIITDKDRLLGYIEELLLPEKDIVILSDDNDIINIKITGRSFFLYIKSLTYAGNPYPLNTTRAQLPRKEEFQAIKDSNGIFLFLGYDEENNVLACWDPTKTKERLNEREYVSFFSRLYLQKIANEQDFVKTSLHNDLKYVLFRLASLPKFLLTINDFFPDLIYSGLTETPEKCQGKLYDLEDDSSIVSYIDELYKNDLNGSILFLVSSCINKFGKIYYNMTLRDWQILVSEYIEQKYTSASEDDEIEEKISDLLDIENKSFGEYDDNSRLLVDFLEREVFPESSEIFRNFIYKILFYPSFSPEETEELFKRYSDGDKNAFDLLVESNLRNVVNIACQFKNCGASLEDLIQVGSLGLINAIKYYRHKNATKFNSYINFGIYAYISDSSLVLPYLLTLPTNIIREHIKYRRLFDEFERQNDYPPSIYDIDLGEEVEINRKIFLSQLPPDFRDSICLIDDYDSFEDNSNMPDKGLMEESTQIYVQGLLSLLNKREEQILQYSFGLNGTTPESLDQIGYRLGLTRERVRQIREKTIRKLKDFLVLRKKEKNEEELNGERTYQLKKNIKKSKKGKEQRTVLSEEQIERRVNIYTVPTHNSSTQNIIREAWDSSFYRYLKQQAQTRAEKEQENKSKLKENILCVLQQYNRPMLLREIVSEVNRRSLEVHIENDIKKILFTMSEVDSWSGGWYLLKKTNQSLNRPKRPKSYILKTTKSKNRPKTFVLNKTPSIEIDNTTYSPSTTLQELVKQKIITKTECKHCKYKGLWTIGDVKEKIEKHNLTRTSTRFTQYTIDLWFRIVGLLKTEEVDKTEEKRQDVLTYLMTPNLEEIYNKYTSQLQKIRQSSKFGSIIKAKPVLLLAIIHGINEGKISNNRIFLNGWLEIRYNTLMYKYNNFILGTTEINMPFWYLKNDGFWHLYFGETQKEITYSPTVNWLRKNVLYAYLDEDLWILLENKEWRTKLQNFIIEHKLTNQ